MAAVAAPHAALEAASPVAPRRRRVRGVAAVSGLALVAFATGLFVFNDLIMPRLIHSVSEVRIPDLTNLTVEQAERVLAPQKIELSRAGERFDPSAPRGFILSQDPPPETPVRGKKRVMVVVSLGEEYSSVPALFGESMRSARVLIERAGLRIGGVTHAPCEDVGDGLVAGSDPPAEAVLPRDGTVSLLVSAGAGEESFVMPDLLGREITGARRELEALGLRVTVPPGAPTRGPVSLQDPPPGSRITRSTGVVLHASGRMIR